MHLLYAVGKKDDLNMEDVREDKEWGGIYEGLGAMDGEECTDIDC